MSVFTPVSPGQLSDWLKQYSVGTLSGLKGIAAGIENTNYFVSTSQGRYVLTLFERIGAGDLPFYLNLMDHVAGQGVPSARPVPDRGGGFLGTLNGKPAALVTFLPGRDIAKPSSVQCAEAGAMLARIHLAGTTYKGQLANPRGPKWWQAVKPEVLPFLEKKDAALLKAETQYQARQRFDGLPRGAIHADLFRDNVLWQRGKISGVIDFYFACTDLLLYDVAIAVNDWCLGRDGGLDARRTAALLEAYRKIRPFAPAEHDAWPALLRAGALRFWVSRLYDFHLPRPGELTHAKDPNHFQRILANHVSRANSLPRLAG